MKFAYICADPGVPVFGRKGCSIHVQEMLRAMLSSGASVELFAARVGGSPPDDLRDCRIHELPVGKHETVIDREVSQLEWNRRVCDVLSGRSFELVYERHSLWSAGAMHWANREGIPSVLEVNAPLIDEQAEHRDLIQRDLAEMLTQQAMAEAALTYVVASEVVPYCRRFMPAGARIAVIPNGVNTRRFSPATAPAAASDAFTVGFVGSLKPWHGIDELLSAFELLHDDSPCYTVRLLIVGDGPRCADVEAFLEQRPKLASSVQLTGAVTAEEVPGYLTSMNVAVAPYPRLSQFYFSPLKLFEYMATGRAIVASSSGQIRSIIRDGENGLLYDAGNAHQLARCLRRLQDHHALRFRVGAAAREDVQQRDWMHVLNQILDLVDVSSTQDDSQTQWTRKSPHGETSIQP